MKKTANSGNIKMYSSNPKHVEILSLNQEYDNEDFDIIDDRNPSVEDQVLDKICPAPTAEELKHKMLAHFDKENPLYAKILRLEFNKKSIEEICIEINLKPNRGRDVINEANDAMCDYLRCPHMKTKHRK